MAEAITNARLGDRWQAYSAGTHPADDVHPKTMAVLAEIGILHQRSPKSIEEYRGKTFDLVVTVCDTAAEECPVWLGPGRRVHADFPDPARATGRDNEVTAAFRQVRDNIAKMIDDLLK